MYKTLLPDFDHDLTKLITFTKNLYKREMGVYPKFHQYGENLHDMEALLRCNMEARYFDIHDNIDKCLVMVQCYEIINQIDTWYNTQTIALIDITADKLNELTHGTARSCRIAKQWSGVADWTTRTKSHADRKWG